MLLDTDLPYLEPLLMWLRDDPKLKDVFTDKSFFMPKLDLEAAAKEAEANGCPSPRSLWIFPLNTSAVTNKPGCNNIGSHEFGIIIWVQCIRDSFELVKTEDKTIKLGGQFMELTALRKLVKNSVKEFSQKNEQNIVNRKFEKLVWSRDRILYPSSDSFLGVSIEFRVNIL